MNFKIRNFIFKFYFKHKIMTQWVGGVGNRISNVSKHAQWFLTSSHDNQASNEPSYFLHINSETIVIEVQ